MLRHLFGFFFCVHLLSTTTLIAGPEDETTDGNPVVATPEPGRPLTQIPLEVVLDPAIEAALTPLQKQLFEAEKERIKGAVFLWGNFEVEMPRPVFQPGVQIIEIAPLTTVDAAGHVKRLGMSPGGQRQPLSPEQWEQLKQESVFSVEDPQNPGQFDVWKVTSSKIHKGRNAIAITFNKSMASALDHITIQFPKALLGDDFLGARKGIRNILFGLRNSLSLIAGLTENNPRYTAAQINALVTAERAKIAGMDPLGRENRNHPDADILADEALLSSALPFLQTVRSEADTQWGLRVQGLRFAIEQKLRDLRIPPADYGQALADRLEFARMDILFEGLLKNEGLKQLNPRLAPALVQHARASALIEVAEHEMERKIQAFRKDRASFYLEKHPIRAQTTGTLDKWVEADAKAEWISIREKGYGQLIQMMASNGMIAEARALQANLDFVSGDETTVLGRLFGAVGGSQAEMRRMLSNETVAAKKYSSSLRIWQAKNWIITSTTDKDGKVVYSGEKYQPLPDVYSNIWGWRLFNVALRTASAFKLGLYGLVYRNFIQGPLGIRALVGIEPFEFLYMVDPDTGQVIPNTNQKMATLTSRLVDGEMHIRKILEDFRKSEDSGMISKRVYGPLYVFWHGFLRRIFQPVLLGLAQAGTTLLINVPGTLVGVLTSPAWAPLAALTNLGFNASVFDFDAPRDTDVGSTPKKFADRTTNQFFPIVSELLGRSAFPGSASLAGGLLKASLWDPAFSIANTGLGLGQGLAEIARDKATRTLLWIVNAKVPTQDPTMLMHRTQGDGVTDGFFFEIGTEPALAGLLAKLEIAELSEYESRMQALIAIPDSKAREYFGTAALLMNGSKSVPSGPQSAVFGPIAASSAAQTKRISDAVEARVKELTALFPEVSAPWKMTEENLEQVLSHGAAVVEVFFTGRVFAEMGTEQIDAFWTNQALTRNNWSGLTRKLLAQAFGEAVLTPIETTQKSFRRTLAPVGMGEMVTSILSGNALPTEGRDTAEWNSEKQPGVIQARFQTPSAQKLCAASLADYGMGMGLPAPIPSPEAHKDRGARTWFGKWMNR